MLGRTPTQAILSWLHSVQFDFFKQAGFGADVEQRRGKGTLSRSARLPRGAGGCAPEYCKDTLHALLPRPLSRSSGRLGYSGDTPFPWGPSTRSADTVRGTRKHEGETESPASSLTRPVSYFGCLSSTSFSPVRLYSEIGVCAVPSLLLPLRCWVNNNFPLGDVLYRHC